VGCGGRAIVGSVVVVGGCVVCGVFCAPGFYRGALVLLVKLQDCLVAVDGVVRRVVVRGETLVQMGLWVWWRERVVAHICGVILGG